MAEKPLAIISGGGGYLGTAIGAMLRERGWDVASLGRHVSSGDDMYQCDITSEEEVQNAVEKIIKRYGKISACIHAAALPIENKPLLTIDAASFDASIAVAVRGAFLLARATIAHMEEGAAFIGITSKLIEQNSSLPGTGAYIAAKYGLRGFLRSLAAEVRPKKIRVYAVAPGFLPGGLNKDVPQTILDFFATKSGVGSTTVEAVSALVTKLCTEPDAYPSNSSITIPPVERSPL